jgi:N-dimethylarginine dimethylaminohydrolase
MAADDKTASTLGSAAYGGENWSQRETDHRDELGTVWAPCAIDSEWRPLRSVLLHEPGDELEAARDDPDAVQMFEPLDLARAREEHAQLAEAYRNQGVAVHFVEPDRSCPPNQMFCADLFVMTPQGAILARPASTVRAGEERPVARRLAALGIPILKTLTGGATFEGADLMWLDPDTAMIGRGPRTNQPAIEQISRLLSELGIETIAFDMPHGTMHFMGMLRIADRDLAIAWPRRTPQATVRALEERGCRVAFAPFGDEADAYRGINFVTLGPRRILMVEGLPALQAWYEDLGIECLCTPTDELSKAAGNVGCLTGILHRDNGA